MRVLNIAVPADLAARWRSWLAPARQPFFLTAGEAQTYGLDVAPRDKITLTPEERDTFAVWGIAPDADRVAWLTPADFGALSPAVQQRLLRFQAQHGRGNLPLGRTFRDLLPDLPARFLWTETLLTDAVLARVVGEGQAACRRAEVPEAVWGQAWPLLPLARNLAGTFTAHSGPNCFGTVMAAAGVAGAENEWMQRAPFEAFLDGRTVPGGPDDAPGTVLVWRSADGLLQHAGVTLGDGWALHKPSQTWLTPRVVLDVGTLKRVSRTRGWRLTRRRLVR